MIRAELAPKPESHLRKVLPYLGIIASGFTLSTMVEIIRESEPIEHVVAGTLSNGYQQLSSHILELANSKSEKFQVSFNNDAVWGVDGRTVTVTDVKQIGKNRFMEQDFSVFEPNGTATTDPTANVPLRVSIQQSTYSLQPDNTYVENGPPNYSFELSNSDEGWSVWIVDGSSEYTESSRVGSPHFAKLPSAEREQLEPLINHAIDLVQSATR